MKDTKKVVRLLKQISNEFDSKDEHDQLVGFIFGTKLAYAQFIYPNYTVFGKLLFDVATFAERGVGDILAEAFIHQSESKTVCH